MLLRGEGGGGRRKHGRALCSAPILNGVGEKNAFEHETTFPPPPFPDRAAALPPSHVRVCRIRRVAKKWPISDQGLSVPCKQVWRVSFFASRPCCCCADQENWLPFFLPNGLWGNNYECVWCCCQSMGIWSLLTHKPKFYQETNLKEFQPCTQ